MKDVSREVAQLSFEQAAVRAPQQVWSARFGQNKNILSLPAVEIRIVQPAVVICYLFLRPHY